MDSDIPAGAYAKGDHERYSPQLYWASGQFSTLDEYVVSKQRVSGGAVATNDSYVTNKAYQIEVGYVLTGEKASYNGVNPASAVQKGGWGAWELVGRINHLEVGEEAFNAGDAAANTSARDATAFAIGLNWYLNRNIKIQLDYELTEFKGGAGTATAVSDRNDENLIVSRFQLLF